MPLNVRFLVMRATLRALAVAAPLVAMFPSPLPAQSGLDDLVPPSPSPAGFIADGGPVLDAAARERLNVRIAEVQRATGGDIAVAILRDLRGRSPHEVGVAIYRAWGVGRVDSIGSARRDLGALLLIVPRELTPTGQGECWISTGIGAEGALRDADAGTICRQAIIPHLREQRYEQAILAGIDGIGAAFARETAGLSPPREVGSRRARRRASVLAALGGGLAALAALGGSFLALVRFRRHRPRPCPRGHGRMVRLDEEADDAELAAGQRTEERIRSVDYDVWACPSCSERLILPYRRWSGHERCPTCGHRTVRKSVRTITHATQSSTGLQEITRACEHCAFTDVSQRVTPRLPPPGSGGGSGGSSRRGSRSSFGGSGRTSGGGGGSRY